MSAQSDLAPLLVGVCEGSETAMEVLPPSVDFQQSVNDFQCDSKPVVMEQQHSTLEQGNMKVEQQLNATESVDLPNRKLFVGGVCHKSTSDSLMAYFSGFGAVHEIDLKMDIERDQHRGFCFVTMTESAALQKVLAQSEHTIDGKRVDCKPALSHEDYQAKKHRTKKVFVGGVPVDMGKELIEAYFVQFGEIEEVALVTDKGSEKRRGFVFVTFQEYSSVDECTRKSFHSLNDCQVEVKRATPRDEDGGGGGYYNGGRGRGRGGMRGGGGRGGGWQPYGGAASYGGYGGESYGGEYFHGDNYGGGYGYGFPGRGGGYGGPSRYGPMKGNQGGGRGYHPYGR